MESKVCVVTVTYGNRFHLLKQVIDAALNEGVYKIIVVDNNSEVESRNKLMEYEKLLNGKIKVLYLDDNYGSAGGFKKGLEEAYNDSECEFIWLLDDDNYPMNGSLKNLLDFWHSLKIENKEEKIALLSYRFKKEQLAREAMIRNKPELILGLKNSFLGFHIKELHRKIYRYLRRRFKLKGNIVEQESDKKFGIVPVAPYGGLFIHKNILNKIGYPNEDFYLYADDHEWSYRITRTGGKIYLILDSKIDDLELSWHVSKSAKETAFSIISKGNHYRVYYSVRNRVFFEINNLVDNKMIYWINIFVYLLLISFSSTKNIKLLIKAVKDGYRGKLGKVEVLK
ncbi:MAG: Glycosyl transferase family 2 [Thermodesulfobacterium commune]|nr:MAG: Glycosyl transferase family 2 [Thermodesulfobacterium commune]